MKTLFTFISVVLIIIGIISCTSTKPSTTEISVLRDITDTHLSQPAANEILPLFNFSEDNKWNRGVFRFSTLSDVSYTRIKETKIEAQNQWLSNELERAKQIQKFKSEIGIFINESMNDSIEKEHSSVYLPITRELIHLSESKAEKRILVVYSDLMENGLDVSLYSKDKFTLLKSNPDAFRSRLETQQALPSLTGIEVYFIYQPTDIEKDKLFNTVSAFYKHLLEEKGANVTIQANLVY